jgi:tRNA(Leu) C34 or U34 (ribose-2'-O)-methylase TrmL
MNFGITHVHFIQKYENLIQNFINKEANSWYKTSSGSVKWMDIRTYNSMTNCLDWIKTNYDPVFICTDVSESAVNLTEMDKHLQQWNEIKNINSQLVSSELLLSQLITYKTYFKKEKIEEFRNIYSDLSLKLKNNDEFIKEIILSGRILDKFYQQNSFQKEKSLIFIFGNESRGVSPFVKRISDLKVTIPHFGYKDTSYNLSVSCGMVLFNLYSKGILHGSFLDFNKENGMELLSRKLISSLPTMHRENIKHYGIQDIFDDL